jgi:dTDP-4-dehydrorhamnose reductase
LEKILLIGANGFLGKNVINLYKSENKLKNKFNLVAADINNTNIPSDIPFHNIDITKQEDLTENLLLIEPDIIILTAAMTDVDQCETNKELATKINFIGPKNVINACKKMGSKLVFMSTDFIFNGEKNNLYTEEDIPKPQSHYGKTKFFAELAILYSEIKYLICRTSVLYGWNPNKLNFMTWILENLKKKNKLSIVTNQINSPTYVDNLANMLFKLIIFIFIIHIPTTLIVYSIPLFITLLVMLHKEPEKLITNYHIKMAKIKRFIREHKAVLLVGAALFIIGTIIFIIFNYSFLLSLITQYMSLGLVGASQNTMELWMKMTIGLIFNVILLITTFYLFKNKKIKKYNHQTLFFLLLNLYLTIYLLFFDFLNKIIRSVYAEFRFIIYLDVSIIILVPIVFSILVKNTQFLNKTGMYVKRKVVLLKKYFKKMNLNLLYNKYKLNRGFNKNISKLSKYINISNFVNFSLFFLIISYSVCRTIPNYEKRYFHKFFEEFWYDSYEYASKYLSETTIGFESYLYNVNSPFSHLWPQLHINLGELRSIDSKQVRMYMFDSLYTSNNSNYRAFLDFVFNEIKFINKKQGNYKELPDYLKISIKVDYIIIDDLAAPNLCELMLNDTNHFTKIFECRMINLIILSSPQNIDSSVYIFKTKSL